MHFSRVVSLKSPPDQYQVSVRRGLGVAVGGVVETMISESWGVGHAVKATASPSSQ